MAPAPWFGTRAKAARKKAREGADALPDGLWTKCPSCSEILFNKELEKNLKVCNKCGYHYKLGAVERIGITIDDGTFAEMDADIVSADPLGFPKYAEQLARFGEKSGLKEAIITGTGEVGGRKVVAGFMDFAFWGGTMGGAVGEKVVRAMEHAIANKLPVIMFVSSGGIRVNEGLPGLMMMGKTAAACARLQQSGIPYIVVLTDPSMAGVLASFGSLGDFIISEPGLLTGLTADRVAAQVQVIHYPDNFRRADFAMEHGMIDRIVARKELKSTLIKLLSFACPEEDEDAA